MPSSQKVPALDSFLTGRKKSPCAYERTAPVELRAQIDKKVAAGVRSWAGYERWLRACGHPVGSGTVSYHYTRCRDGQA